ncbi:MAG TPA: hypothetical protein VEP90_27785, partial [Methylomirabilota bacterium]|nr:hypothetical protein [Methylomirabilota bacterium]
MKEIRLQRRHLETSQELDRMSGSVPTLSRIPKSANNPRDKAKSEGKSHSLEEFKSSTMVKGKRACCFLKSDEPVWIDLTTFS